MSPPEAAADTSPRGADPIARIAAFAQTASFETTRLSAEDIEQVKRAAPKGSTIYVAAIPSRPLAEQVETARNLREAGFEPVPHLAARNFESVEAMEGQLRQLVEQAGTRRVLVIAGDRPDAAGPFKDSLSIIETGALQRHGIVEVGISGHPDGHPRVSDAVLEQAMSDKIAAADRAGLNVRIVTQFTMSTQPIVDFVTRVRARGIKNHISIGLAGPTSMTTLLRFAKLCGVKASTQGLARNIGLVKNLIGASTADPIVRALADMKDQLGDVSPHFFSFGGLPATTRWVNAAATGRITLTSEGFEVAK
ncbi:MAG TPA: methylenetetrahydrofolate reductase [Xanthobacteraceae bacterium]|nr:methylenetetrahydrofolate reductase [Xanthobacteraceae bacterium]